MNKIYSILLFFGSIIINKEQLNAQVTAPNNIYNPINFVGFNNTNGINPLFFRTNVTDRMVINGNKTVGINGYGGQVTNGFIGIGPNPAAQGFPWNAANAGPFSLLHLNSGVGGFVQSFGWRPWMKYGITSTHNQDLMFIGQRQNGNGFDVTDVVIGWADNSGPGAVGPDNMVFNFLTGGANGTDDLAGTASNGREIMRLTGYGNVGIGPRFNNTWQPQSTLHQHQENSQPSWMQITNQLSGGVANAGAPTNIQATDGLRWGIDGANTAYLYNQENSHLLFSTNHTAGGNFAGTTERMRISHIGAPGITNPGNLPLNTTRVSISHNPNAPVTEPLSLLHLGYNTGGVSTNPNATDGWRSWMDIGMFVTNNTDNVYIGLKDENGPLGDRQDAVLSWGDNQVSALPAGNGPDNFRFIFTSSTTGGNGTPPATGADGLEGMRLTPTANTGVFTGVGGAPIFNPYSTGQNAGNTMEINSWGATNAAGGSSGLRFTNLNTTSPTLVNPGPGVLSVDAAGDVIYVPGGTGTANNGIFISNTGLVQLGGACSSGAELLASRLLTSRAVFLNNNSFWFEDSNNSTGGVGVGGQPASTAFCGTGNTFEISANLNNAKYGNTDASGLRFTKLTSASPVIANGTNGVNTGKVLSVDSDGDVVLINATSSSFGAACSAPIASSNLATDWRVGMNNFSVNFDGTGNVNIGDLQGCVAGSSSPGRLWVRNTFGSPNPNTGLRVDNSGLPGVAYAGEFFGDVIINGVPYSTQPNFTISDQRIKTNVQAIPTPIDIINKLKPVKYTLDNTQAPQLNIDGNTNYGFIAQQVGSVIPELVKQTTLNGRRDSLGNEVDSAIVLNALNYTGLIPFAIGGIQQLDKKQSELQAQIEKAGLSDQQVKTNVANFNALAKINSLNPVKYNFTNANVPQLSFTPNDDYGFIAQQLETVYPELVDTLRIPAKLDSAGNVLHAPKTLKTVNYKAMSALLVRSIQEQQFTIDSLKNVLNAKDIAQDARLAALENAIAQCCSNAQARQHTGSQSNLNQQDIELSDKDAIVLNQNVPNPFAEQTTITYNVPESVGKAQILFYNSAGQIIQTVDIKTRGKGKVNVFASDLSSGLYHYTLVADGKVIDSKKMVRE